MKWRAQILSRTRFIEFGTEIGQDRQHEVKKVKHDLHRGLCYGVTAFLLLNFVILYPSDNANFEQLLALLCCFFRGRIEE